MPEARARLAFPAVHASGRWRARVLGESVTLFVESHEVVVRLETSGEELAAPLQSLRGASWRGGTLALHLADEALRLRGGEGLDRAWHAVTLRACTLPEVARGLRRLGAAHGDDAHEHARFIAPLLQARRRLESEEPMDWKVAGCDAATLAERVRAVLAAIAQERHAPRPPYRRALEAELLDAADPMLGQLEHLGMVARQVHEADDAERFVHWRAWAGEMRALFVQADRSWQAVSTVLARAHRRFPRVGNG